MRGRLRGLKRLVHDAVDVTLDYVREGNASARRAVRTVAAPIDGVREVVDAVSVVHDVATEGVLATIHTTNRAVEVLTEAGLDIALGPEPPDAEDDVRPVPMRSDQTRTGVWFADAALGALNAAVGDRLGSRHGPLELAMTLRIGDAYVAPTREALAEALPEPSAEVVVLVHGLGTTEWSWALQAEALHGDPSENYATALARDLGVTCVLVRYNTGRPIRANGAALDGLLDALVAHYPAPLEGVHIIGHSMGGLVSRSACHHAEARDAAWAPLLRTVTYLGSPHHGAPLARLAHTLGHTLSAIDLPAPRIIGGLLRQRSAGVYDLRHDAITPDGWGDAEGDVSPLAHAHHCFISGSVARSPEHVASRALGDLLVPVASATREPAPASAEPDGAPPTADVARHHVGGVLHHQLSNHPDVYALLRDTLASTRAATPT